MEEDEIQINGGITINVDASAKNIMYMKKITFRILLHVIVKMENIQQALQIIQGLFVLKLQSHSMKKQKQFQQTLMKKI